VTEVEKDYDSVLAAAAGRSEGEEDDAAPDEDAGDDENEGAVSQ